MNAEAATEAPLLVPDRAEAERFILALVGSVDAPVTFQTFSDPKPWREKKVDERGRPWPKDEKGKPKDPLARVRHGTLAARWDELVRLNRAGAGIYIMVNQGDGRGRSNENVRNGGALRALFLDDDSGELTLTALEVIEPSIAVQSRHGLQPYWRLRAGERLEHFTTAQEAFAHRFGCDPAIKDLARVMRLPGFFHQKDRAEPFPIRIVQVKDVIYSIADVVVGFGLEIREPEKRARGVGESNGHARCRTEHERRYIEDVIAKARREIESAEIGTRNPKLTKWAYILGGHVGSGHLARSVAAAELAAAASRAGLEEGEYQDVIDRQIDAGALAPLDIPEEPERRDQPPPPESENPPGTGGTPTDASSQFEPFSGAKVPSFPVEALPAPLARYVEALATHLQVPADGPALMALAVLAAACAKRIRVRRLADGYEQPLNLYLLGLGPPGERKSQIVAEVVRPLRAHEAREAERLAQQIAIERQTRQLDEDRMKVIRRTLASGKVRGDPKTLRAELDDLTLAMAKPALRAPRLVTSSPTSGALEQLLAENGERMAILSAEGGAFGIVAGRFAGNSKAPPDMDVYLSAWSGDAGDADRVSREGTRLKAPALTIGLFVQPQVLREVSSIYGADEKGLTSRFLIANVPPCADRQQYLGLPMDEERRDAWARTVDALLGRLPEQEQVIVLRTEILGPAEQFFNEVTPQMTPGGPMSGTVLRAFASKLRGQVERLVGVLHVAEHGPAAADMPCSERTVAAASTLARYFLAHGKAALGEAGSDPVLDRAHRVVDYLVYNQITTFTRRDVQIGKWGGCRKPEQVDETLLELETRGYLTKTFAKRERPGASGPIYYLRPGLF